MSERTKKFGDGLDRLIKDGEQLAMAMQYGCVPEQFKKAYLKVFNGNERELRALIESLPNFTEKYQAWYTEAQAVIKQVTPDRLADFLSYFDIPRGRKDITYQNYMIRDYLQRLRVTRGWEDEVVVDSSAAIPQFH